MTLTDKIKQIKLEIDSNPKVKKNLKIQFEILSKAIIKNLETT